MAEKMKVVAAEGTPSATFSEIDIDVSAPASIKRKIQQDIGEYIVEQVLLTTGDAKSPVSGERWPALARDSNYRAQKIKAGLRPVADMENQGNLKDSLTFKTGKTLKVGFFDTEAWKADGHLKFSGKDGFAPRRRFLPGEGQEFIGPIQAGIEDIIADGLLQAEELNKKDFKTVETKQELYGMLKERFPDLSASEIRAAVMRDDSLSSLLDELDLLDLL